MESRATSEYELNSEGQLLPLPEVIEGIEQFLKATEPRRPQNDATMAQYLANYLRRHRLGVLYKPDVGDEYQRISRRTYLFNRAALVFGTRERFRRFMEEVQEGFSGTDVAALEQYGGELLRIAGTVRVVAPPGERVDELGSKSRFNLTGGPSAQSELLFVAKTSKRDGLATLGSNWRQRFWSKVDQRSKYATALAALDLTGARPFEQELGGKIERVSESTLEVTLYGAKQSSTTGIPLRTFRFEFSQELKHREAQVAKRETSGRPSSVWVRPPVLLLADLVPEVGKVQTWTCKRKGLASAVGSVGLRAFPRHKYKISPISFRHEFATDLKNSDMIRVEAAAAMSHRSTATLDTYGRTLSRSRGRRVLPKVVSDVSMIRTNTNAAPKWSEVRAKSAAKSVDAKREPARKLGPRST